MLKKTEFTLTTIGAKFVLILAGKFMMGSPEDEEYRLDHETHHKVTISKPFYMQTTPVTQGQWEEIMGDNPSYRTGNDDLPVEKVSWDDVQEFIEKLNQRERERNNTGYLRNPSGNMRQEQGQQMPDTESWMR